MKPVVWLFLLFIVASGLSAWIGNDWGRRLGKRKLSVFSLRPKHTSTLLTILLSMALSLGCLGVYLLIDPHTREALLDPAARDERQLQAYQQQNAQLSTTLRRLTGRGRPDPVKADLPLADAPLRLALRPGDVSAGQSRTISPIQGTTHRPGAARTARAASGQRSQAPQSTRPLPARQPAPIQLAQARSAATTGTPDKPLQQPVRRPLTAPAQAERLAAEPAAPTARASRARQQQLTTAAGSWQRHTPRQTPPEAEPRQLAMRPAPLFQLRVFGGRSQAESSQIVDGVLDLTRSYARGLGLAAATPELLELLPANLAQSRQALEQEQIWQIQVQIGQPAANDQALPVRLVLQPEAADTSFDPHQLLEQARLSPESGSRSLQDDLRLAILDLARSSRQELQFEPASQSDTGVMTASLPFTVVQLRRAGQTLQGQILFSGDAENLTEN